MTRLVLDVSTLARWTGPPVGMVRVESELVRFARDLESPVLLAFFDPVRQQFRGLSDNWRDALIGWHASIDPYGIDYRRSRAGWRGWLVLSRAGMMRGLERVRLTTNRRRVAAAAEVMQKLILAVKLHDHPFCDPEGRRISLVPGDLALTSPITLRPGDVIFIAASDWSRKNPSILRSLKRHTGVRIAAICYDIIPITHPQFFPAGDVLIFREYWEAMFGVLDIIIVNADAIRRDIVAHCRACNIPVPQISVVPLGSGLPARARLPVALPAGLEADRFVLFVSTIEPRKNHAMLLDAWERLVARGVPQREHFKLVFVGRAGWMTDDVMRRLGSNASIKTTVIHLRQADDEMLRVLYENAAFCVYPSLYEGYGLPVAEALAHGKAVIASNGGALAEVAGPWCHIADPNNIAAWETAIEDWMENPERRCAAARYVHDNFRPVNWSVAAGAMLAAAGVQSAGNASAVLYS